MRVPTDKVIHALAGACIAATFYPISLGTSVLLLVLIGAGKEVVYDKIMGRGTPSVLDAFVTIWAGLWMLLWLEIAKFYL